MADEATTDLDTTRQTAVESIAKAFDDLAFGSVEITVHDGHIVEIVRREKQRVDSPIETATPTSDDDED